VSPRVDTVDDGKRLLLVRRLGSRLQAFIGLCMLGITTLFAVMLGDEIFRGDNAGLSEILAGNNCGLEPCVPRSRSAAAT
jgi:hypothetical protein